MARISRLLAATLAATVALLGSGEAADVKVGFIGVYTGPESGAGSQIQRGAHLYMKIHPRVPGDHKIEFIERDTAGPSPDRAKRLALELVTRDKVDLLMGLQYSNEAFAVMDVCRESRVPVLITNAGTASITQHCPYVARVSFTMWQAAYPMGEYAAKKMNIKTAAVVYANYAPGKDSKTAFQEAFEQSGGRVVSDVPLPFPNLPDFTPFMQRVKDTKPQAVYVFVPAGKWATGIMKVYHELGMKDAGITLIGPGDIVQDAELPNMGDVPIGVVTVHHYSAAAKRPENVAFVKAWKEAYGADSTPDFLGVQGWDGMAAVYHVIEKTGGKITPESYLEALKTWRYASPRGPILIDPETRDIVDNQYIRRVEKIDGKLANVEFDVIEMVRDPWKALGKKEQ